ncbi:hypothetical protein HJG60_008368 [Phyllostomus discolor]|uniref:Uncharacterized protein n=1 Tax=Phyllostomus discolor TaxID=89673 RepID=A0A833Z4W0_9CHIR|nr:hypothetical protein HJG60_008368 [Phyllostomus discolor]
MDINIQGEESSPGPGGLPVSTGTAEFVVQLAKAGTLLPSNHFIKEAVTVTAEAGHLGHVNSVASKSLTWGLPKPRKAAVGHLFQKTPGNKESGAPGLTPAWAGRKMTAAKASVGSNAKGALGMVTPLLAFLSLSSAALTALGAVTTLGQSDRHRILDFNK